MISIRAVTPQEWSKYRDVRLQALQDSPDAFGSTWEAEVARADDNWSERLAAAATGGKDRVLFAINDEQVCGLIWCKLSDSEPGVADIYQMWVEPAVRGQGAGHALLTQALAWAKKCGTQLVRLGVTVADSPAMRLYKAHGFFPVGNLALLRQGSELQVQAMELNWACAAAR
ncbi:GNAT family N-acetyltransferase [Comamonas sp. lk]|uniref:GNAT family N-acetyltransferase n=1 Tax=Comamonas sp. lk TaxID=2201272 RepID=UPI000EB4855C|nr:GNAT family N-acetyltransferase [Comamonas sp. lk]